MPLSSQPINSTKNVEFSIAKFDISWPNKTMEAKMKRKKKIKKRIFPPFFFQVSTMSKGIFGFKHIDKAFAYS